MKKRILIILTGGTISMDSHKDLSTEILQLQEQRLMSLSHGVLDQIDIETNIFLMKPSPQITPDDMLSLSKYIENISKQNMYDGFVITHGTDTLEETAYFLSLYNPIPSKPIVFTGSMRNFSDIAYDGLINLVSALLVASHKKASEYGVLVVLNDSIFLAREVTKSHTVALDTFKSFDFGPIGYVDDYEILFYRDYHHDETFSKPSDLSHKVLPYKTFTGDSGETLLLAKDHYEGFVIEGFGRGNVPDTLIPAIQTLLNAHKQVMITSRTPMGRVYGTYPYDGGGGHLVKLGCVLSPMLNTQKARIYLLFKLNTK
jgi:L-asparaginase